MGFVFLGLCALVLATNVVAAGLVVDRRLGSPALAKVAVIATAVLVLFCFEHSVGVGRLSWALLPLTALSAWIVWRRWASGERHWLGREAVFCTAFLLALAWRCAFPDINGHSEQLHELAMVTSYLAGEQLPPVDYWLPEFRLDMYYPLQFYATALLGRLLGISPGYAINLAGPLATALIAALVWDLCAVWQVPARWRGLPAIALLLGGTGLAPLVHLAVERPTATRGEAAFAAVNDLWFSVRFSGMYAGQVNTSLGRALFPAVPAGIDAELDLPMETPAYLMFQGDFHPPVGGFLLMVATVLAMSLAGSARSTGEGPAYPAAPARAPPSRVLQCLIGATVPLSIALNAWVFPLQALLVGAWALTRYDRGRLDLIALVGGAGVALVLLQPFLVGFSAHALDAQFRLVQFAQHTRIDRFLGLHWPALVLIALVLSQRGRPEGRVFAIVFALILVTAEVLRVDDGLGGPYARFNTVLKWWSWEYAGVIATCGAIALSQPGVRRWIAATVLLAVSLYAVDLARYWIYSDKPSFARMEGHHWLTSAPVERGMMVWLRAAPMGNVLEGLDGEAYTPASALALFAGKPSATGWPHHEAQWRADSYYVNQLAPAIHSFYQGQLADPLRWLDMRAVRYIVWSARDQTRSPAARAQIDAAIGSQFAWKQFGVADGAPVGLWVRR